jgi:glycerol-3-phosphate O-acyltransferase/dihydroxyacetone phosphate acyltransferase
MALGAMEKYNISVKLVSCGFTYYQPEKFRSKVIMEYGHPYTIPQSLVEMYRTDKKRAISTLLSNVEEVYILLI